MIDIENLPKIGERSAEDILELLARPFKPEVIRSRRVGGKDVRYLPITAVVERLNKSCNVWSFRILDREMITMLLNRWDDQAKKSQPRETMVFTVVGELTIPELGTRCGLGVQAVDPGSGEDLLKGAPADALKKAAGLFGLWQPPLD
jgi:hypothetical protein